MSDMNDLMAETTRLLLAFMAGMLTAPLFYWLGARRQSRPPAGRGSSK